MSELTVINSYMPVMALVEAKARRMALTQFVRELMVEGTDYGTIPGTDKPTLYKPGAEKLNTLFGFSSRFIVAEKETDWTGANHNGEPFFYFSYRCQLWRNDALTAESDGSCNSMEKKYRYRWIPAHEATRMGIDVSTAPTQGGRISEFDFAIDKSETGGKYGKPASYWQQFKDAIQKGTAKHIKKKIKDGSERDAVEIDSTLVRTPNPDIADLVNTIQKMSQKRALVAATLLAVNASEYFTMDLEDMPGFGDGEVIDGTSKPVNHEPQQQAQKQPAAEQHAANQERLVRSGQDTDFSKPATPPPAKTTAPAASDAKTRIVKHRDEAIEMVSKLTAAAFDKEAAKLDTVIRNANTAIERGNSDTALHSHADRLKQLVTEATTFLAEPVIA
jgi:hypothetical protein